MGGINLDGDGGLNTELNLVPFIDLLSTLVLFLLLSAVWVQIAAIPAATEIKGKAHKKVTDEKRFNVHITQAGCQVNAGGFSRVIPAAGGLINKDGLLAFGREIVKHRVITNAAVSADNNVAYGQVVFAIDILKEAGFISVALGAN